MEIKKAWNIFKKEIVKEGIDVSGNCYMTARQIANRTATILVCSNMPYAEQIEREDKSLAQVMGYDSWTDEQKARSKESHDVRVAIYKRDMEKFGTKENELKVTLEQIKNSNAFKKFCVNAEIEDTVRLSTETKVQYGIGYYYIRIDY